MGAHSLGGARPENSGYQGKWTGPQNRGFNELYYLSMINATNKWLNIVRIVLPHVSNSTNVCQILGAGWL